MLKPLSAVIEILIRLLILFVVAPMTRLLDLLGLCKVFWLYLGKRGPLNDLKPAFGNYQPTAHDILICTFSKSGTNWMLQIAYQITQGGQDDYDHIHDVIPWPDSGPLKTISLADTHIRDNSPTGLRVIKTHSIVEHVPYNENAKYITVIRDPKEVFVSSYYFLQSSIAGKMMPSVETWLDLFLSPYFILGDWATHTAGYWKLRHHDNVMLIQFADLKQNHKSYIHQIADFLDVRLNEDEVHQVLEKSSFAYMKQHDQKFAPPIKPPWLSEAGKMIRRGKSGSSSELLSGQQQKRIDDYMQEQLTKHSSDFPYTTWFIVG